MANIGLISVVGGGEVQHFFCRSQKIMSVYEYIILFEYVWCFPKQFSIEDIDNTGKSRQLFLCL